MRLLQKTIRSYLVYSALIFLVATPAFYLVIRRIVREDTDEHLEDSKAILKPRVIAAVSQNNLSSLNLLGQDILLLRSSSRIPSETFSNIDVYDSISAETVPYRVLLDNFLVNGQPYLLQVRNSMLDSDDLIATIVIVQAVLLLILLSGLLLINRNLSKRIWSPFYTMLDKLRNYQVEQPQALSLVQSSISEFSDLGRSLEELTTRAHRTYLIQKEFTENASHEIQTPLAIFQNKLELLMQTDPLNEEQAALIDDLASVSQRMVKLNKSLILLTRIENLQFRETETIQIREVIEKALADFEPQSEQLHLRVSHEITHDRVVAANRSLVEILVGNLLGNAIRYNFSGGRIYILQSDEKLVIQNTGRPASLDPQQIFRRFYKESSHPGSIGLGLQIASQICRLYGWSLDYSFGKDMHRFTVYFM